MSRYALDSSPTGRRFVGTDINPGCCKDESGGGGKGEEELTKRLEIAHNGYWNAITHEIRRTLNNPAHSQISPLSLHRIILGPA